MVIPRTYATPGAFRRALEERLKSMSQTEQIDINRLRRQVSFDRLLARLFQEDPAPWVLKGGYAVIQPLETVECHDWLGFAATRTDDLSGTAIRRQDSAFPASAKLAEWRGE